MTCSYVVSQYQNLQLRGFALANRLVELSAEHPKPESVRTMLRAVGVDLEIQAGTEAELIATIECLRGRVKLQ